MHYKSYISFSTLVAAFYVAIGSHFFHIHPENLLLAAIIIVLCGMLPNIDASREEPAKEMGALIAAIAPFIVLEAFPQLQSSGIARISLVIIGSYLVTRIVIVRTLLQYTEPRGLIHSIPAAILAFEAVYLIYWDLYWVDRLFLAGAAFSGYFGHLMLDAYGNLDILGQATGKPVSGKPVLKLWGESAGLSFALYAGVAFLGYYVFSDIMPHVQAWYYQPPT